MIGIFKGFLRLGSVGLALVASASVVACGGEAPRKAGLAVLGASGRSSAHEPHGSRGSEGPNSPSAEDPAGGKDHPEVLTDEEERLRKLQAVRLYVNGTEQEISRSEFAGIVSSYCWYGPQSTCSAQSQFPSTSEPCWGVYVACTAKIELAAASPQASDTVISSNGNSYRIPNQSPGAASALAKEALEFIQLQGIPVASGAMVNAAGAWNVPSGYAVNSGYPNLSNLGFTVSLVGELYGLYLSAADLYIQNTLAVADAQLDGTRGPEAIRQAQSALSLSRAAAAHLLVGGAYGIEGDTNRTLCTQSLTPPVQEAIAILRDSGVPPSLLSGSATLAAALNTDAQSVRSRLGNFYGEATLMTGRLVEDHYGLDLDSFAAARGYLNDEIKAFGRSTTATLDKRRTPSGPSTFDSYAGTSSEPVSSKGVFSAMTRHTGNLALASNPPASARMDLDWQVPTAWNSKVPALVNTNLRMDPLYYPAPVAFVVDNIQTWAAVTLAGLKVMQPSISTTELTAVANMLENLRSTHRRLGRVALEHLTTPPKLNAYAYGFSTGDGVALAVGDDAMRCAVDGTIEGAPCTLYGKTNGTPTARNPVQVVPLTDSVTGEASAPGLVGVAKVQIDSTAAAYPGRLYFVKRKPGVATNMPGSYEVLTGLARLRAGEVRSLPVIPEIDRRVEEIIEPSRKNCARSKFECSGAVFDERLPLENDLLSDGDAVESSWKQYLVKARDAANEADRLADEYVGSGFTLLENEITNEDRHEEQLRVASEKIRNANQICGSNIEPRRLLTLFENDPAPTGSCTTDSNCAFGKCIAGSCQVTMKDRVARLAGLASSQSLPEYPDLQRLNNCLSSADVCTGPTCSVQFASLGDQPLCMWYQTSNPNAVCKQSDGVTPSPNCPQRKGSFQRTSDPCTVQLTGIAPSGTTIVETTALGYFPPDTGGGEPTPNADRCIALAAARQSPSANGLPQDLWERIARGGWAHPTWLDRASKRLWLRHQYDPADTTPFTLVAGLTAGDTAGEIYPPTSHLPYISLDDEMYYGTGATQSGVQTSYWPCAARGAGINCASPTCQGNKCSLFCRPQNCTTATGIAEAKRMLARTLVATRYLGSWNDAQIEVPLLIRTNTAFETDAWWDKGTVIPSYTSVPVLALLNPTYGRWTPIDAGGFRQPYGLSEVHPYGGKKVIYTNPTGPRSELTSTVDYLKASLQGRDDFVDFTTDDRNWGWEGRQTAPAVVLGSAATLDTQTLLDGYELLCDIMRDDSREAVLTGAPPIVQSASDLGKARDHLIRTAQSIRDMASMAIFANLPTAAIDNLREESATGAYSALGGGFAETVTDLRTALQEVRSAGPLIAGEIAEFGYDFGEIGAQLELSKIQIDMSQIRFFSTLADRTAQCAASAGEAASAKAIAGGAARAAVTCVNSVVQIGLAAHLAQLEEQASAQQRQISISEFGRRAADRSSALQQLGFRLFGAFEKIDATLARVETLRNDAAASLQEGLYYASYASEAQQRLTTSLTNLGDAKKQRYQAALTNAKRMTSLARRAIEQRIGVRFDDLKDPLPLLDRAPASWANEICTLESFPFSDLAVDNGVKTQHRYPTYIGDYVTRLENLVESYRLQYPFHEGSDRAVISLRDDVLNVRDVCTVESRNLLPAAGRLDSSAWKQLNCATTGEGVPNNCLSVRLATPPADFPLELDGLAKPYLPARGAGASAASTLVQEVELGQGTYRFSLYSDTVPATGGTSSARAEVSLVTGSATIGIVTTRSAPGKTPDSSVPVLSTSIITVTQGQRAKVRVGVGLNLPFTGALPWIAAPVLERLEPGEPNVPPYAPYTRVDGAGLGQAAVCEDTDGDLFRASRWTYRCVNLCGDGFGNECGGSRAKKYCYWERPFSLSQRAIQSGRVLNYSGFARGNFNYRIESVGLNFVGSASRDCTGENLPSTCYGAGFIPYSIEHNGPFYVRNHTGADFEALLFDGRIEHARGLALERYLTNPLSSSDGELIEQFMRPELQGRPLDGNFVIKVWDEPGVNFDGVEDIQVVLNYRYWTRFE